MSRLYLTVMVIVALCFVPILSCGAAYAEKETPTLTWWTRERPVISSGYAEEIVQRFEEQYPYVKVNVEPYMGDDAYVVRSAAGVGPDISEYGRKRLALKGAYLDLTKYIERDLSEEDVADFVPGVYQAAQFHVGPKAGQQWGLPYYTNAPMFYYNIDWINEAGLEQLDSLAESGRWTYKTYEEYARKLTEYNADGSVKRYGVYSSTWLGRPSWIWAFGGRVTNYPENPDECLLGEPPALKALEWMYSLIWEARVWKGDGPRFKGWDFKEGTVAIHDEGPQVFLDYKQQIAGAFDFAIAPRPQGPVSQGNRVSVDVWTINATTKYPDEAWEFLKYLTSAEAMELLMKMTMMAPARISVAKEYANYYREIPGLHHYVHALQTARPNPLDFLTYPDEFTQIVRQPLRQSLREGLMTPKMALDKALPAWEAFLAQKGKR